MSAFVSARQAAELCGVSEKTIRRWIAAGRLTADKQGREFQIALDDLAAFGAKASPPDEAAEDEPEPVSPPAYVATVIPPDSAPEAEPAVSYLADIVRELQAELTAKTEAAATWQSRAELLARELEMVRRQLWEQNLELPEAEQAPVQGGFHVPRWHPLVVAALAIACVMALVALLDSALSQNWLLR
jgi:excisionase family DNA binding protein